MIERLAELLIELDKNKPQDFNGLGLIVYENLNKLPISNFNNEEELLLPKVAFEDIIKTLIMVSRFSSPYHDGFHLLSNELILTGVSKYFATPIVENLTISNNYGSRYRTALYGSFIDSVLCTAVLSKNYGPIIFENGNEINPYFVSKNG